MKMKSFALLLLLNAGLGIAWAQPGAESAKAANGALSKGAAFLVKSQNGDGSWTKTNMPGITGLCILALADAPVDKAKRDAALAKAYKSLAAHAKENGAIAPMGERNGKKGLSYATYNTSIALLALSTCKSKEYVPVMQKARAFLKSTQVRQGGMVSHGGFAYGSGGNRADLSNTTWAAEALYFTEYLDKEPHTKKGDERRVENKKMWETVHTFIDQCYALDANGIPKTDKVKGAFSYIPGKLATFGSMTYAGLKAMLYSKLKKSDHRVKSTFKFACLHFTVDENPGMGNNGLYSYLHTLSKALDAYGQSELKLKDGKTVNWRDAVIQRLTKLQKEDGSWVNDKGRFMESVPELASAYAMISMKKSLGKAEN